MEAGERSLAFLGVLDLGVIFRLWLAVDRENAGGFLVTKLLVRLVLKSVYLIIGCLGGFTQ